MIAKCGVVFPSKRFVALKLGGVFSNTVNYSVRAAFFVHGLKGLVNLPSFESTSTPIFLCFPDQIYWKWSGLCQGAGIEFLV